MKAKPIKSTKPSKETLYAFRVIVRGTRGTGKAVHRVRHVFTTPAIDEGAAVQAAERRAAKVMSQLKDVYISVLPPLTKAA